MPRRAQPESVVLSMCVNGNGTSCAIHEPVADISLQLYAVSLTKNLWAGQAHKEDKGAGKRCSWVHIGKTRRGEQKRCSEVVVAGDMFCKVHRKCHEGPLSTDVSRQEIIADNNAVRSPGSIDSITETAGNPAIFNYMGRKIDAERKSANKTKWENILSKFCAEFPRLEIYARTNPSFDMPDEMYDDLPEDLNWEFVHVRAVHLTVATQKEIMANLSAKFTYDGFVKAASNVANGYVNLLADDGPGSSCTYWPSASLPATCPYVC